MSTWQQGLGGGPAGPSSQPSSFDEVPGTLISKSNIAHSQLFFNRPAAKVCAGSSHDALPAIPEARSSCGGGAPSISQHQLQAFSTIVDEVYESYGQADEGSNNAGNRRSPGVAGQHRGDSPPKPQPLLPSLPSAAAFPLARFWGSQRDAAASAPPPHTRDSEEAASGGGDAEGNDGGRDPSPSKPPRPTSATAATDAVPPRTGARLPSPLPLTSLPTLLLPRRWTDGVGAATATATTAASASSFTLPNSHHRAAPNPNPSASTSTFTLRRVTFSVVGASAPHAHTHGPPAPAPPPAPPCHLLELPNELLLLITLACVTPPGAAGGRDLAAALRGCAGGGGGGRAGGGYYSPGRTPGGGGGGYTPRGAPGSPPGWSFALIASPNPSPRRSGGGGGLGRAARGVMQRISGGGGGGGGGSSGGEADYGMAGLRAVACAAMTCRRLRGAYRLLLAARPDLELQAEAALRSLHEKRRLVRRLTITQHDAYVARELAAEGAAGVAVAAALALLCGAFGACTPGGGGLAAQQLTNYVVFTAVHVLLHTAILAAAYRTSAWLGTRRSLALGLAGLAAHYLLLVPGGQVLLSLPPVPPHLNLEPWQRRPTDPPPCYPLAALLWPLYGDGLHWRLIHLASNGFAWAYGAYEWHHSFSRVRLRNGLRY